MIGRSVKIKFVVFIVIGVVAVSFTALRYGGVWSAVGNDYNVTVDLAKGGGIFRNAEVTYRGVPVGKVTKLGLTGDGMRLTMQLKASAPKIPASTRAVVTDRSAIGEQYVDLLPKSKSGPYLHEGSRIPKERTAVPVSPERMLTAVDKLANNVPTHALRTVVDELDTGFSGAGPDLRKLMDSANSFVATADKNIPQTKQLLNSGGTVLSTQRKMSKHLQTFSSGLRGITAQLRKSDPDIRKITKQAPKVGNEVQHFLNRSGAGLSAVLANLLTTSETLRPRIPAIRQLLVGLPMIGGVSPTLSRGDKGHLAFQVSFFQPPPCVKGYEGTKQHAGTDEGDYKPNQAAYCAEPKGSPVLVRGAQNAPYGGKPPKPAKPSKLPGGMPGVVGDVSGSGGPGSLKQLYGLPK